MPTSVPSVSRPTLPWPCPTTLMLVAKREAVKAVEAELKAQGLRPSYVPMKRINAEADAYFVEHRDELIAEASQVIARWPGLRKIAEQEARRRIKAIQKTSLQQGTKSSTATRAERARLTHTAIDPFSNRQST
jgi:hypothetical protein